MHTISSYRGNRPHTHTNRQDRLQYTAPQLASAQCKKYISNSSKCNQQGSVNDAESTTAH